MLEILRDLVARGVRVTTLVKPGIELVDPSVLTSLTNAGVTVRQRPNMHEKVVFVDDRVAYFGSLNALSNTGRTSEVMLRFVGQQTTSVLLDQMRQAARPNAVKSKRKTRYQKPVGTRCLRWLGE